MTQNRKHKILGYDHTLEEQKKIERDIKEDRAMVYIFLFATVCSCIVILGSLNII